MPSNAVDGLRLNTGVSYLRAALNRPNLTVVGNSRVLRVGISSGRATGVLVDHGGRHTIFRRWRSRALRRVLRHPAPVAPVGHRTAHRL
nr:GMC family oxidoreductase N-terminal domain-containing protein [Streptomyces olivochromogenes]